MAQERESPAGVTFATDVSVCPSGPERVLREPGSQGRSPGATSWGMTWGRLWLPTDGCDFHGL